MSNLNILKRHSPSGTLTSSRVPFFALQYYWYEYTKAFFLKAKKATAMSVGESLVAGALAGKK